MHYGDIVGRNKELTAGKAAKTTMLPNAGREMDFKKKNGERFQLDTRGGVERATDKLGLTTRFDPKPNYK